MTPQESEIYVRVHRSKLQRGEISREEYERAYAEYALANTQRIVTFHEFLQDTHGYQGPPITLADYQPILKEWEAQLAEEEHEEDESDRRLRAHQRRQSQKYFTFERQIQEGDALSYWYVGMSFASQAGYVLARNGQGIAYIITRIS